MNNNSILLINNIHLIYMSYNRIDTTYNVINLYNLDSRKKSAPFSYKNMNNIECDTSANLFEMFGKFSKYFVCQEHLQNTYQDSPDYVANPGCLKCGYVFYDNDGFFIPTNMENNSNIINRQVRQQSSTRTNILKTRIARDKSACRPWNNRSSSVMASIISNNNVPSRGNSVRTTLTRHRPGASSAPGKGVDVKHGSYERYLLKKKYNNLKC